MPVDKPGLLRVGYAEGHGARKQSKDSTCFIDGLGPLFCSKSSTNVG